MGLIRNASQVKQEFMDGLIDSHDAFVALQYLGQSAEQARTATDAWVIELDRLEQEAMREQEVTCLLQHFDERGLLPDAILSVLERTRELLTEQEGSPTNPQATF